MAKTVNSAFSEFLKNKVNLDPQQTRRARTSKNWLRSQINSFPDRTENFPKIYSAKNIDFGSFARRTKKRELDDIDLMVCLSADHATYFEGFGSITINTSTESKTLKSFCKPETNELSSTKIINKFISSLKTIPQYQSAEIKRNGEAATLKLNSYSWNFDIVPCFFTTPDHSERSYYLIPDGNGNWKKTDPRIDQERVSTTNKQNTGRILNIIRILKYWNSRPTMPSMSSYLLENIIINYYNGAFNEAGAFVDIETKCLLSHITTKIYEDVPDPKGLQGNINSLSFDDKRKISERASGDHAKATEAREAENNDDHKTAINKWREIFGKEFPEYG